MLVYNSFSPNKNVLHLQFLFRFQIMDLCSKMQFIYSIWTNYVIIDKICMY